MEVDTITAREMQIGDPKIKQLLRISPSRYAAMQSCLLREVWSSSGNETLLPPSPAAELGHVIHQLLETAGRGQLAEASKGQMDETWTRLILEAENRMLQSQVRRLLVPLSKSVPDFEVRRLRAYKRASEIAHESAHAAGSQEELVSSGTGFEFWIETDDGAVGGYIDRAKRANGGIVLLDYKSGAIFETVSNGRACKVKDAYKDQMELYAALYRNKFDEWPLSLEIIPLQGAVVKLEWEAASAERLLASARRLLHDANIRIAEVLRGSAEAMSLASPRAENCRLCLFRAACRAYWTVRQYDSLQRWPQDVKGILREKIALRNGTLCLRIVADPSSPEHAISIRNIGSSPQRHPILLSLQTGSRLAVYCLRYLRRSNDYTETQSTIIYQMD